MEITAKDIKLAMDDLRARRITAEEFRAVMRSSREHNGETEHDRLKAIAIAASSR